MTFVKRNCLEQLTYSGVFEAVSIRKQGFPFRLKHKEFVDRYNCIIGDPSVGNVVEGCKKILDSMKFEKKNVKSLFSFDSDSDVVCVYMRLFCFF